MATVRCEFDVEVERIDAASALPYWESAGQRTVFTHPKVLATLARDVHWWLARVAGQPACLWPVCLDSTGRVAAPEFSYYLGPFDLQPPDPSPRRRLVRAVAVQGGLLDVLTRTYGRLAWSTVPGQHDLRPWLWKNLPQGQALSVKPRYTAVIDGLDGIRESDIARGFGRERQGHLRRSRRLMATTLPCAGPARTKELYRITLAASGAEAVAQRRSREIDALFKVIADGFGFTVSCGHGDDGVVRAVWLILESNGRACEVLGASEPDWRSQGLNAYGRFQAINMARLRGASCYDFNGANSMARGTDKHSYGAEPGLYFDLSV
jgi:hypothetical protein